MVIPLFKRTGGWKREKNGCRRENGRVFTFANGKRSYASNAWTTADVQSGCLNCKSPDTPKLIQCRRREENISVFKLQRTHLKNAETVRSESYCICSVSAVAWRLMHMSCGDRIRNPGLNLHSNHLRSQYIAISRNVFVVLCIQWTSKEFSVAWLMTFFKISYRWKKVIQVFHRARNVVQIFSV